MTDWKYQKIDLKYQLSDYTLFSVALPLQVANSSFADSTTTLENIRPRTDRLSNECRGYLIRGLPIASGLPVITEHNGYLYYAPHQYNHYFIEMNTTFSDYSAKFSSKTRSTLKRKVRKYEKSCGGNIRWETYSHPEHMREFFRLAREVSVLTYQERLFDGGIPDSEPFIENAIALAFEDQIRAYILFDGDVPVSYLYCPVNKGVLTYAYLGYNPAYSKLSVGSVLQWLALEQLFDESKFCYFDFTEGESPHKRLFATNHRHCANVYMFRNTLSNSALMRSHWCIERASRILGSWAQSLGVKAKLRRLLRGQ